MSDDSQSDVDEIEHDKQYGSYEITPKYLKISELLKIAKFANQADTINALLTLETLIVGDKEKICILNLGGVQLLVNLIKTQHQRSIIASLKVLKALCTHYFIIDEIIKLQGLQYLVMMIGTNYKVRMKTLANQTQMILTLDVLQLMAVSRRVKRLIRSFSGIAHLVRFLSINTSFYLEKLMGHKFSRNTDTPDTSRELLSGRRRVTISLNSNKFQDIDLSELLMLHLAANVLWSCCENKGNVASLLGYNILGVLLDLLYLQICEIDLPIMGVLNQCCIVEEFCKEAIASDLIYHCIRCLRHERHHTMQLVSLQAIFKCVGHSDKAKVLVHKLGGLKAIMRVIKANINNKVSQVIAGLHTLVVCLQGSIKNCEWLNLDDHLEIIIRLIRNSNDEKVIEYCFVILKEFMNASNENCTRLLKQNISDIFIENLQLTNDNVIVAVNGALKVGLKNQIFKRTLLLKGALQLLWSNMTREHPESIFSSADVLFNLVDDPLETSESIRSIMGGLEMLVRLMKSQINEIITYVGNLVSRVALDQANQTILVSFGILEAILNQCKTNNPDVRKSLCYCIVSFCNNISCRAKLRGAIRYIGGWLHSSDLSVKYEAVHALFFLSYDEDNCMLMNECGIFKHLIELMRQFGNESLQKECTLCVSNIKKTIMSSTLQGVESKIWLK